MTQEEIQQKAYEVYPLDLDRHMIIEGEPYDNNKEKREAYIRGLTDSKPSLPSNLDEAAITQMEEDGDIDHFVRKGIYEIALKYARLGAEWRAGQGVKLHGRILPGRRGNLYIESDCFDRGFGGLNYKFSDSNDVDMFVQIAK